MQWQQVTLTKTNGFLNWNISGRDIALVDLTGLSLSTNIMLVHSDINATLSTDVNRRDLAFGLIDNVVVTLVPEPTVATMAGLGLTALVGFLRRRNR